ncbi:aminotransferase class V-fold PLP-dependent enzyme [Okeanomitos corallinicola TIOX110]|uniref:Aminotransferase class V-fold PLP-dependent enzyme n=1 Tax=Okeanomitos corallinicola TIOX110 TaxID=3133117 RepID=A0ABZ2UY09_9CYAN
MESLDIKWIRSQFPALTQTINGNPAIFFDGPGGTQVPGAVLDNINDYLVRSNANAHGYFTTSMRTDAVINSARAAIADFLGCDNDEVVFSANMTTLAFSVSRAIGRELQPGDEIVVTKLDHAANISPWVALEEQGVKVKIVDVNIADCTLDLTDLETKINSKTKLVAVTYASNAVGTINDITNIVKLAHSFGALVFVDAVHYAPHAPINVHHLDCDFLACSAYKFFAPHVGILYAKREHLTRFSPYKVKPASNEVPSRWETGTLNHEGLAGLVATINYLAKLGCHVSPTLDNELIDSLIAADREGLTTFHCPRFLTSETQENHELASAYHSRRAALLAAMTAIQQYERELSKKLISGLLEIPGVQVYGITEPEKFNWRTPTVAITIDGKKPAEIAKILGEKGIFTWHGNFYAMELTEKLGVEKSGGLLRIGLAHYNTGEEIEQCLQTISTCCRQ